jgi:hypothetical protein
MTHFANTAEKLLSSIHWVLFKNETNLTELREAD